MRTAYDSQTELRNDVHIVTTNYFINRCPLVTRLPRVPVGSTTFQAIIGRKWSRDANGETQCESTRISQFCQTFTHPVENRARETAEWHGLHTNRPHAPFEPAKMDAMSNLMDDMEVSAYYSRGEDPATCGRPRMRGLRSLLTTNKTTEPLNADAYTASDLIRDTLQRCRDNGGDPDVLLLSSDLFAGLATWGHAVQRIDAGSTIFGIPIGVYESELFQGVTIIEAPLFRPGTAVSLTSSEVRLRMKRNEFWNPRGSRGDTTEGSFVAECAIEVENEAHHAWVEGITKLSAV